MDADEFIDILAETLGVLDGFSNVQQVLPGPALEVTMPDGTTFLVTAVLADVEHSEP